MNVGRFHHFAAIDWSGAAGERHKGIAVALCSKGKTAPELVKPGHRWSRPEVLDWLRDDMPADTLVGLDLGISLPFTDCGAFFPGWDKSPASAHALWAMIDQICVHDPHLGAASFVDHPQASRYFRRHGGREGEHFRAGQATNGQGRFRETEMEQRKQGCKPYSNFNLVGAAQVGKSSLTGMRLLHHLHGHIPVWPMDPKPESGSLIVEIYTTIAAMAAGRTASRSKMRNVEELNAALTALGSEQWEARTRIDDHQADALVTAAWLRNVAHTPELWQPQTLTPTLAAQEGWTFGIK
ncbi:hypothetical protein GRI39_06165 [Altererythrobacter indicus]|uniref:DUF429 domain-containing protein n=1 Tax=Altericroceibacterium indicum TaxID=374177 RepID=A0A845AAQ4_9SPHN|nr:hypothetical protein [Altericroceibacterium indicum]MXP25626.1 hypothetical protein [Altericroceibacterium indicum]